MSGHSRWSQIKHKKESVDQKRGQLFSKLLNAVSIAAREESNPQFNPKLRSAIERARQFSVPRDNIEKAIRKAGSREEDMERIIMEAYGPGGVAFIIEAITSNKNRTIQEVKALLKSHEGRPAGPGGVRWAFSTKETQTGWQPKFEQEIDSETKTKIRALAKKLENHNDVQKVYTNANF